MWPPCRGQGGHMRVMARLSRYDQHSENGTLWGSLPMLEVLKLTHAYRDHVALEDVSFEIAESELVRIVGTSGCGKTPVLRAIAGLVQPTSGEMMLSGVPITGVPDGLAVVFQ